MLVVGCVAQAENKEMLARDNYQTGGSTNDSSESDAALDEQVAMLHLDHLDAKLTKMTDDQSEYTGIPKKGPFKSKNYRY